MVNFWCLVPMGDFGWDALTSALNKRNSDQSPQPSQGGSPTLQTGWGDWSLLRYFKTDARASTLKSPLGTSPKVYPWGNNEFSGQPSKEANNTG